MAESIMVALSGGVDSSLAAALLVEQGHHVVGATLKTFCYAATPVTPKACCGLEGVAAARAVATHLGIEHLVFDVETDFRREVVADFVAEYAAGRTPNPCVRCNATVKIPWLLHKARSMGFSAVATGHYATIHACKGNSPSDDTPALALSRGHDIDKDQSYFLWQLPMEVLPFLRLPIGGLAKAEVRAKAERRKLPTANRPESQEICFVANGSYLDFLRLHLPADHPGLQQGPILDGNGSNVGLHDGYLGFTVGQRKGIGGGHGQRLFVTAIRPRQRAIVIGTETALYSTTLTMDRVNFFVPPKQLSAEKQLTVQIRHRSPAVTCHLEEMKCYEPLQCHEPQQQYEHSSTSPADAQPGKESTHTATTAGPVLRLRLEQPVRAVTPGQSAVIYCGNRVVAGGRINRDEREFLLNR